MKNLHTNFTSYLKTVQISDFIRRNFIFYNSYLETVKSVLEYNLEERKRFTLDRLDIVLKKACKTDYAKEVKASNDINSWQVLRKDYVRDNLNKLLLSPKLFSIPISSSGTTGTPLKFYRSFKSVVFEQAVFDYFLKGFDIKPKHSKAAVLRGDFIKSPSEISPPFWRYENDNKRLILSSSHSSLDNIDVYYKELEKFKPEYIFAYPSSIESLCHLLNKRNKILNVKLLITSSEIFNCESKKEIREVLNCEFLDIYGQAERVAFAYSLSNNEYYFLPGYSYIEFLPVENLGNQTLYEIVGTSLWNLAMPLIRYRTDDLILLPSSYTEKELEEVRYGIRSFKGILGRKDDFIILEDGRKLNGLQHIPLNLENIRRVQLIQEDYTLLRVLILPKQGFSEQDKEDLIKSIYKKIPKDIEAKIEIVDELIKLNNGKTPFVIRNIKS